MKFAKNQRWADSDYFLFDRVDPTAEDRVGIRLAAPLEASSLVGGRSSFSNHVKSRLFDEPDRLSTFDLEVTLPVDRREIDRLVESGYRELLTFYRSRSLLP